MTEAAFIYDIILSKHVLREDHPLRPFRLQYAYELLDAYGAFDGSTSKIVSPQPADEDILLTFHTKDYIEVVKSLSRGEKVSNQSTYNFSIYGDNPPYEGMYEASILPVGASLIAAKVVADGEFDVAFNISGGLHHAASNYASGFCVFNDLVIAIKSLLGKGMRVAYIDIDAHHGDGVQNAFYDSDKVLTISIHESGSFLFPGTGEVTEIGTGDGKGYAVNLPLYPHTEDDTYLWAFREIVPPLVTSFKPDIVVSQLGCDTHYLDPLTHLMLTTWGYTEVVKEVKRLAPRWVALGGGGYDMGTVARCWTLAYGVMIGKDWEDEVPEAYQQKYGIKKLRDKDVPQLADRTKDQVRSSAQEMVEELRRLVFPKHGL